MFNSPTPFGGQNRIKLTKKGYIKSIAITLGIVIFIVLAAFEFRHFSNTFNFGRLLLWALILGVLIGVLISNQFKEKVESQLEQVQLYILCIVLSVLAMPVIISVSNRLLTFQPVQKERVEFVQETAYTASRFGITDKIEAKPDGGYLFFIKDYELERVKVRYAQFPEAKKGDIIGLPIQKGLWGFKYFIEQDME